MEGWGVVLCLSGWLRDRKASPPPIVTMERALFTLSAITDDSHGIRGGANE